MEACASEYSPFSPPEQRPSVVLLDRGRLVQRLGPSTGLRRSAFNSLCDPEQVIKSLVPPFPLLSMGDNKTSLLYRGIRRIKPFKTGEVFGYCGNRDCREVAPLFCYWIFCCIGSVEAGRAEV